MAKDKGINLEDISFDDLEDEEFVEDLTGDDLLEVDGDKVNLNKNNKKEEESSLEEEEKEEEKKVEDKVEKKEEIEEIEEEDDEEEKIETRVIDDVVNILGIKEDLETEGFSLDSIDDSVEGIVEVIKKSRDVLADQIIDKFFNSHPLLGEFADFVIDGGDPENFIRVAFPEMDYGKVEIKEDDILLQERLIRDNLKGQHLSDEEIKQSITDYKDAGILYNQSKRALTALKVSQGKEKEKLLEEQKALAEEQEKQLNDFWTQVEDRVKEAKDFSGIPIGEKEKTNFIDYLRKPVDNDGNTQRNIDIAKLDLDSRLLFDYLMFKGFKIDGIIDRKAKTKIASDLKSRLNNRSKDESKSRENRRRRSSSSVDNPDLDEIEVDDFFTA